VERGDGSDYVYGLDLRPSQAACSGPEGGAPADAAGHRRREEKERSYRRQQDLRLLAVRFSAGVLHGSDRDSRTAAHPALPQPTGAPDGADENQDQRATDGSRRELQQTALAQSRLFPRTAGEQPRYR